MARRQAAALAAAKREALEALEVARLLWEIEEARLAYQAEVQRQADEMTAAGLLQGFTNSKVSAWYLTCRSHFILFIFIFSVSII